MRPNAVERTPERFTVAVQLAGHRLIGNNARDKGPTERRAMQKRKDKGLRRRSRKREEEEKRRREVEMLEERGREVEVEEVTGRGGVSISSRPE